MQRTQAPHAVRTTVAGPSRPRRSHARALGTAPPTGTKRLRNLVLGTLLGVPSLPVALACRAEDPRLGDPETCARYGGIPPRWPEHDNAGMAFIPGGTFTPGTRHGYREERPVGPVSLAAFWIDRTEVTYAQYSRFVAATGYVTAAERQGVAPVFRAPSPGELEARPYAWWSEVRLANVHHPHGPKSEARPSEPAVQIAYEDALAYADWLGHRLPSEAEWEYAARAGMKDDALAGPPLDDTGDRGWLANVWQGEFPSVDTAVDGHAGLAPVGCFPANAHGLYDTIGNVWEWTSTPYDDHHDLHPTHCEAAGADEPRVIKGGSFLCSPDFCARYRVTARHPQDPTMMAGHLGFRTVRSAAAPAPTPP